MSKDKKTEESIEITDTPESLDDIDEDTLEEEVVEERDPEPHIEEAEVYRNKRHPRILKYIIVILVILATAAAILGYIFGPKVSKIEITGEIELDKSSKYDFEVFDGKLIMCNKNGIYAMDSKENIKWKYETRISNPFLKTYKNKLLVVDKTQSTGRVFDKKGKLISDVEFDGDFINASVNKNGWITAVVRLKGYRAQVCVYDDIGKLKYSWSSANNDVICAELADDNETLAVAQIDSSKAKEANGLISLFDINYRGKSYFSRNTDSNIITYIRWSGDNLVCVGGDYTVKINQDGSEKWRYEYPGKLKFYNVKNDKVFVFATEDNSTSSKKTTKIYTVNIDGKELGNTKVEGDVINIDTYKNYVAVFTPNSIISLGKDASLKRTSMLSRDISNGLMIASKSKYFVVSGKGAEIVSVS